ncbi:methionine ABC transporter ATP-binding protein [Ruegeria marisrubri]|uniref:Methionine ABC transporter ATP-binding protein n=1 Tax=Ruegeria marisrubri TaxID=1685379 RepID=A0A0X3TBZ0_9RHOB|nr:ATP-binding cassette domain-containing protein [Ruegeria marisrubri]KUJ73203.1 methionine ABC transporter ATP-binding protein [Ruegeria marisrubri]
MDHGAAPAQPDTCAIEASDIRFSWPNSAFSMTVSEFRVQRGEKLLLLGESGGGKSTLLSLICGVVSPDQGSIRVAGQELTNLSTFRRDRLRANKIGVIFQMFNLLPYASAVENILVPLCFSPERRTRCTTPRDEALELAAALGLPRNLVTDEPASNLSAGQQQRVAVARAMIGRPEIIVADEPTSALDKKSQAEFIDLLFDQVAQAGSTLIMVSHDERLADRFDRTVQLSDLVVTSGVAVA